MSISTSTRTTRRSTIIEYRRETPRPAGIEPIQSEPRIYAEDPFRARFGFKLPRGLREEARGMEWRTFTTTYAPTGNLRINNLEADSRRGGMYHFTATMIEGTGCERISTETEIMATGRHLHLRLQQQPPYLGHGLRRHRRPVGRCRHELRSPPDLRITPRQNPTTPIPGVHTVYPRDGFFAEVSRNPCHLPVSW